jgi:hypothetical protein
MGGTKVAVSIGEPYKVSTDTAKTNTPRLEAELSYAGKFGDNTIQGWLSGLYQGGERSDAAKVRPGEKNNSTGAAYGASVAMKNGIGLMASGYYGKGLGLVSVQDGDFLGSTSTDAAGKERTHLGFLAQATYAVTPAVTLGVNYGQSRQKESAADKTAASSPVETQGAGTASVTYAFNSFTKFTVEYTNAKNTWMDGVTQQSNQFALGSTFFW